MNEESYFCRTLSDQVNENSATSSPASFVPIDLTEMILLLLAAMASSTASRNASPSRQVKVVMLVAFL